MTEQHAEHPDTPVAQSAAQTIVASGYAALDLITYFTAGPAETRAWTIPRGTRAPRAAARIHTDLQKSFIAAKLYSLPALEEHGVDEDTLKRNGAVKMVGKEYEVQDGDVLEFVVKR